MGAELLKKDPGKKILIRIPFEHKVTGKKVNVTIFEREEEDGVDPSSLMLNAATTCWKAISKDRDAVMATKLLNESGCNWVFVLFVVEHYCQHVRPEEKEKHVKFTEGMTKLNKKIAKFASSVAKWEARINRMNSQIEDELPIDVAAHAPSLTAYKLVLDVASMLALPSMMDLKGKKGCVICLHHFARLSTGRAHYEELADILQARLNADSQDKEIDIRDLKDTVRRFKQKDPAGYRESEKAIRTLVKGDHFAAYQLPPADLTETKVTPV
jgi:hypothetical protein